MHAAAKTSLPNGRRDTGPSDAPAAEGPPPCPARAAPASDPRSIARAVLDMSELRIRQERRRLAGAAATARPTPEAALRRAYGSFSMIQAQLAMGEGADQIWAEILDAKRAIEAALAPSSPEGPRAAE